MNKYYIVKQFRKGHMSMTNKLTTNITGKRIILLECACKERFYTRADLNWHMITQCHIFRQYIL